MLLNSEVRDLNPGDGSAWDSVTAMENVGEQAPRRRANYLTGFKDNFRQV